MRKVIYLVPSNTMASTMVTAARRLPGETRGETAGSSADAAEEPTGADADADHAARHELRSAAPEYELKRAWLGTPTNSMTSQSARRSSGATEAAAEEVSVEVSESEAAEQEGKEPSQANAAGEREISEAAPSRDGEGSTVFI